MIKHKKGKENIVVDACHTLISTLDAKMFGFSFMRDLYASDSDYGEIYHTCMTKGSKDQFYMHDGYLFQVKKICIIIVLFVCCLFMRLMGVV